MTYTGPVATHRETASSDPTHTKIAFLATERLSESMLPVSFSNIKLRSILIWNDHRPQGLFTATAR